MNTISLCMIVKNEEAVLKRCLESTAGIVDEIIIVDTGSTDNTVDIAKSFTKHVYSFEWQDDFSAARNFSFSKATKDYIMWLDADDVIDEENREKFLNIKKILQPNMAKIMLPYNITFNADGTPNISNYRERIVLRKSNPVWREPVHEHLVALGNVVQFDAAVSHRPGKRNHSHSDRNLSIYRKQVETGKPLSIRGMYYFARELKDHQLWDEAIAQYETVLCEKGIWVEDAITGSGDLSDCYLKKGNEDKALEVLFASFIRDLPRAENICRIGSIYFNRKDYSKSIFWYNLVLNLPRPNGWGFIAEDYWGYIPHMQLCASYDRIGEREKALMHHEAAKALKPESTGVAYNEAYFYKKS